VCTLVVAFHHLTNRPLVVLANRDERLDRPAAPPRRWPGEPFVAPRDLAAGGTWLGLTDGGMFVGITNRFGVPKDDARKSRGDLVVRALRAPSARALHASLAGLDPLLYNAFHLLYVDRDAVFVTWSDGSALHQATLGAGVSVVTERSLGGSDEGRTEAILARMTALGTGADQEALEETMRIHGEPPPHGTCVHLPELGYGTRSSMTLVVGEDGRPAMRFADGKPCVTPYRDVDEA
jgi:uncharacterized protein with NRDE domain